jgi:hypothetical protein
MNQRRREQVRKSKRLELSLEKLEPQDIVEGPAQTPRQQRARRRKSKPHT